MMGKDKETPYIVGYWYEMNFNEFGIGGTGFNAINESTFDD